MKFNESDLKELLGKVFDDRQGDLKDELEPAEYDQRRYDFVFHMTDWLNDLDGLSRLYASPKTQDVDEATLFVIGFLYHVIPHLTAAGRLLLGDVRDTFAKADRQRKQRVRRKKAS